MREKNINKTSLYTWSISSALGSAVIGVHSYLKFGKTDSALTTFGFYLFFSLILSFHSYFILRKVFKTVDGSGHKARKRLLILTSAAALLTLFAFVPFFIFYFVSDNSRIKEETLEFFERVIPIYIVASIVTIALIAKPFWNDIPITETIEQDDQV